MFHIQYVGIFVICVSIFIFLTCLISIKCYEIIFKIVYSVNFESVFSITVPTKCTCSLYDSTFTFTPNSDYTITCAVCAFSWFSE